MSIKYKTEGLIQIDCKNNVCSPIALTWIKGEKSLTIHNGSGHFDISKSQLRQILDAGEIIADDLNPDAGSLPRPA